MHTRAMAEPPVRARETMLPTGGALLPLTRTLLMPSQVVWRKIMWVVGTTITQTCSLVVMTFAGIGKTKILGVTTAVLKSIFICVNIGYSRHLLRRPYTSHRRSAQMGDPMCVPTRADTPNPTTR